MYISNTNGCNLTILHVDDDTQVTEKTGEEYRLDVPDHKEREVRNFHVFLGDKGNLYRRMRVPFSYLTRRD